MARTGTLLIDQAVRTLQNYAASERDFSKRTDMSNAINVLGHIHVVLLTKPFVDLVVDKRVEAVMENDVLGGVTLHLERVLGATGQHAEAHQGISDLRRLAGDLQLFATRLPGLPTTLPDDE